MRILHIISDSVLGGAQKVCIDLANSAISEGYEVAVAAMPDGPLWTQLESEVKQFGLVHMNKKIGLNLLKVIKELKKIRTEYKPDIIHLHTSIPGILGRWVFRKEKNHIVYTVHGFDQIRIAHKKFLPIEKFFQKYSGAIVAVSDYDMKNMNDSGIRKKLKLIYNGISLSSIKPVSNLPEKIKEKKLVLTIARIAPPKNIELFSEVAKEFINKDTAFVWIGGSQNLTVEELRKKYNMPDNLYLLGDLKNASNYINLCDVFVLFSKHEGLPMSIIEAMSQGKSIVASNVGGIPELIDFGLINIKEEAVEKISLLLEEQEKNKEIGQKSLEKFNNNFTLEKMWKEYKNLYLELLENK